MSSGAECHKFLRPVEPGGHGPQAHEAGGPPGSAELGNRLVGNGMEPGFPPPNRLLRGFAPGIFRREGVRPRGMPQRVPGFFGAVLLRREAEVSRPQREEASTARPGQLEGMREASNGQGVPGGHGPQEGAATQAEPNGGRAGDESPQTRRLERVTPHRLPTLREILNLQSTDSISEAVERALTHAPIINSGDLEKPSDDTHEIKGTLSTLAILRGMSDDAIQPVNHNLHPDMPFPNCVYIQSADDLRLAVRQFYSVTDMEIPDEMISEEVEHELQHVDAAIAQDATEYVYGLSITKVRKPDKILYWSWQPFNIARYVAPKLGIAAYTAHPKIPSHEDVIDLEEMGYKGVQDVGARIEAWNRTHTKKIPLPLSYQSKN